MRAWKYPKTTDEQSRSPILRKTISEPRRGPTRNGDRRGTGNDAHVCRACTLARRLSLGGPNSWSVLPIIRGLGIQFPSGAQKSSEYWLGDRSSVVLEYFQVLIYLIYKFKITIIIITITIIIIKYYYYYDNDNSIIMMSIMMIMIMMMFTMIKWRLKFLAP